MSKPLNEKIIDAVRQYNAEGYTDSRIARLLNCNPQYIHYYRKTVLGLPANFRHRNYDDEESRLKGYMLRNIRASAKRRGYECTIEYLTISLPKLCPLLGIELCYRSQHEPNKFNASNRATIDRIDNTKGYTNENIWVLSRLANSMKNEATPEQLNAFCKNYLELTKNHRALGGITD